MYRFLYAYGLKKFLYTFTNLITHTRVGIQSHNCPYTFTDSFAVVAPYINRSLYDALVLSHMTSVHIPWLFPCLASVNVLVPSCKIYNDASCDISADGQLLAVFIPSSQRGFPDEGMLAVYSLAPHNLGEMLYTKRFGG